MKTSLLILALMASTVTAQAGTRYCQDVGSGVLEMKGDKAALTTVGLGASDGVMKLVNLTQKESQPQFVGFFSDFLKVPVASYVEYNGKAQKGGFPVRLYIVDTEKDQKGRVQQVLLISLAGGEPMLVGVDVNCKE